VSSVLVCDDHRIVREGLRHILRDLPGVQRVEVAASGEEVLARFPVEQPDLVLMDVRMPGLGGLEATRRLVAEHPSANVIILSREGRPDQVEDAVRHGARGYLAKDAGSEELRGAVTAALAGKDLIDSSLRRTLTDRQPSPSSTGPQLSVRELQVLRGMSNGQSNRQIGRQLFLSEDTVKTHARRLFRKLGVNDRAEAVAVGFRSGLIH
jgi:DNA-binding NarL/FixJ family response regulator